MKIIKALLARQTTKWVPTQVWIVLAVLVLVLQACSLPSSPYDVYVTTGGNDGNNCLSLAASCLTLREAINKANTGSVIHVGAGTFSSAINIHVNKLVTIQGVSQSQTTIVNLIIDERITATLSDISIQGGFYGVWVLNNSHLIGNNLTIRGASGCITNETSGRIELTNTLLSACENGILNSGIFTGNHISIQGTTSGGILNWGAMDLQNTSVEGTTGTTSTNSPAGIAVYNATRSGSGDGIGGRLRFTNGIIFNNYGPGLWNSDGSTATITSSTISGNQSDGLENHVGGTMWLDHVEVENNRGMGINGSRGSTLTISNSGIANNRTKGIEVGDGSGGAFFTFIQNSTISGNDVGVESFNTQIFLYFVTVAYNSYGVFFHGGTPAITNSIVELNTHWNCGHVDSAHIQANAQSLICDDTLTNATLHLGDAALGQGSMIIPLLEGSPAIDHADDTCPPTDQRGYGRPHGARCDVGAYEFGSVMALVIASPATPPATPRFLLFPSETTATWTPVEGYGKVITPTPTQTPTPAGPPTFKLNKNAFCRKGPDMTFSDVTAITAGETVDILNVSEDGFWYFIYWKKFDAKCWVATGTGDVNGDVTGIKVLVGPSLPAPKPAEPILPKPVLPPACTSYSDASSCTTHGCSWDKPTSSCK